ncbi:MAG TPA: enoyl-CoA hydratase/isomerase family protein [Sphingomonas sp.]
MTRPTLCIERRDGIATLLLNRPDRRNAIDAAGWHAIKAAVDAQNNDPDCLVMIIRGAGEHFGAGADIREFPVIFETREGIYAYFAAMEAAMEAIEATPKPVVAAIEGMCIGACVALALACDVRIASASSSFAITPAKLGIIYPYRDVARVVQAIGAGRARSLLFTGRAISGKEARDIGLIDHLVDDDGFDREVTSFASLLKRSSQATIRASKQAVRSVLGGMDASGAGYPDALVEAIEGIDFREGIAAFLTKRAPDFAFRSPPA